MYARFELGYHSTPNGENLQKLIMSNFSKNKINKSGKRAKCLARDSGNCLSRTNKNSVELSIHLSDSTHEYMMLGNFTSEHEN